jgi:hypothetical protein
VVNRRLATILAAATLAVAIPAGASAAPPELGDRGYCPGGVIRTYVELFGGRALGEAIQTYQEVFGTTFSEAIRAMCRD